MCPWIVSAHCVCGIGLVARSGQDSYCWVYEDTKLNYVNVAFLNNEGPMTYTCIFGAGYKLPLLFNTDGVGEWHLCEYVQESIQFTVLRVWMWRYLFNPDISILACPW